jgi:hypothetical protein
MSALRGQVQEQGFGRRNLGDEPLVYHCNFYNYWLQKTVLLVDDLGMEEVIQDAAAASAFACLKGLSGQDSEQAEALFAYLGFGQIDLSEVTAAGGHATTSVSHYGQCLSSAAGVPFAKPQSRFDAGFAAGAGAWAHGRLASGFGASIQACMSVGAEQGKVGLKGRVQPDFMQTYGMGPASTDARPPNTWAAVDQAAVDQAVQALHLVGNEEGLIPRFGVMLTQHFAHFYNRLSFEFLRRMSHTGMRMAGEHLLIDAGYRCAFHTFGGIFNSAEWEALMGSKVASREAGAHSMASIVSALGWGRWRLVEISDRRAVLRLYDDYESLGYQAMYGAASRPVAFLAAGGLGGLMNLLYLGDVLDKPVLDNDYFERVFEHPDSFAVHQTKSIAMGDAYSEIVADR